MRVVIWAMILAGCFLLQACIEGDEEVWIKKDGSARVAAVYRVPMMLLSEQDAQDFKASLERGVGGNPNLRLETNKIVREQGRRVIQIVISTDDLTQLEAITTKHDEDVERSKGDKILHAILGQINVKMQGLNAKLHREVDLAPLIDEYVGKNAALMLSDAEFRYTVHLPTEVDSSNAHQVTNSGKTLRWVYGLSELKGQPIVMTMRARVPIPWWVYGLGVGLVLVCLLLGVWFLLRRRKKVSKVVLHGD